MGVRMRLEEGVSLSGSLDALRAARDEVFAVDLRLAWGGGGSAEFFSLLSLYKSL